MSAKDNLSELEKLIKEQNQEIRRGHLVKYEPFIALSLDSAKSLPYGGTLIDVIQAERVNGVFVEGRRPHRQRATFLACPIHGVKDLTTWSDGAMVCKACRREPYRARTGSTGYNIKCPHGWPECTILNREGRRVCRQCANAYQRNRNAKLKQHTSDSPVSIVEKRREK